LSDPAGDYLTQGGMGGGSCNTNRENQGGRVGKRVLADPNSGKRWELGKRRKGNRRQKNGRGGTEGATYWWKNTFFKSKTSGRKGGTGDIRFKVESRYV